MDLEGLRGLDITIETGTADTAGVRPGGAVDTVSLPQDYRSFARSVEENGSYLVTEYGVDSVRRFVYKTHPADRDECHIAEGTPFTAQYDVADTLCDSYYLYPADQLPLVWTVRFDSNGGSEVPDQRIPDGDRAIRPGDPVRSGDRFGAWYLNPELTEKYDFGRQIHQDLVLYASWTREEPVTPPYDPGPAPGPDGTPDRGVEPEVPDVPGEEEVEIPEPEVPAGDLPELPERLPEPDIPAEPPVLLPEDPGEWIIIDEEIPLGNLPQTGTGQGSPVLFRAMAALTLIASMIAAAAAWYPGKRDRK